MTLRPRQPDRLVAARPASRIVDDRRRLFDLLSADELALLLAQDSTFTLPVVSQFRQARMVEAKELLMFAGYERNVEPDYREEAV